jgi:hypothetical protein
MRRGGRRFGKRKHWTQKQQENEFLWEIGAGNIGTPMRSTVGYVLCVNPTSANQGGSIIPASNYVSEYAQNIDYIPPQGNEDSTQYILRVIEALRTSANTNNVANTASPYVPQMKYKVKNFTVEIEITVVAFNNEQQGDDRQLFTPTLGTNKGLSGVYCMIFYMPYALMGLLRGTQIGAVSYSVQVGTPANTIPNPGVEGNREGTLPWNLPEIYPQYRIVRKLIDAADFRSYTMWSNQARILDPGDQIIFFMRVTNRGEAAALNMTLVYDYVSVPAV